jgi:hypothetical protein
MPLPRPPACPPLARGRLPTLGGGAAWLLAGGGSVVPPASTPGSGPAGARGGGVSVLCRGSRPILSVKVVGREALRL